ncbi:CRISPR-associated protein Cas4 [Methanobrevibacter curvatus]|uniref:CRISPR-associated exonuclease Cas4 n=1 Tax=Methanobrevibacter curvatus TaxID=49547 RepID=A0A166DH49_9EURY|nr:CRISPR-associated protein Cas4 [Methanobrevibacter curvatus]KZX15598.1 PD-(D/E)XK nuclease superfamily protein [Methanobrevibacter curvatus]
MISLSSIQEYMFCPLKLFLRNNVDNNQEDSILINKTIKRIRIDIQDLLHRNIRGLKKEMDVEEIKEYLSRNIKDTTIESLNILKERSDVLESEYKEIKDDLMNDISFSVDLLSVQVKNAMKNLEEDGSEISEMFFPTALYNYLIKDNGLEVIGSCDKIEIVEGRYIPIDIKNSIPPVQGVWDGDAIKLVANAMLIEQEFDTEVFVGYIDYLKLGQKRQVIMDSKLRKSLFKVLHQVKEILYEGIAPEIKSTPGKCSKCEYYDICQGDDDTFREISN